MSRRDPHHSVPESPLPLRGREFRRGDEASGQAPVPAQFEAAQSRVQPEPPSPAPFLRRRPARPSNPGAVVPERAPAQPLTGAAVAGEGAVPEPTPLEGGVLPFRRTAVKPRRKRRSLWLRWVRPALTAALMVSLPVAAAHWVLTSPRFQLVEVEVWGSEQVSEDWVRSRLAPMRGENLVLLPLEGVETSLRDHPWIAAVSIHKRLPDGLTVELQERRARALIPGPDGEPWLADADGRAIEPAAPGAGEGLVRVVPAPERGAAVGSLASAVPGAVEVAEALTRHHPAWAHGLERIEALGYGDYRLHTRALPFPVLVRSGAVAPPMAHLEAALPGLARELADEMETVAAVDLRFPGRLVLRATATVPAADRTAEAGEALQDELFLDAMTEPTGLPSPGGEDPRRKVG